MTENLIGYMYKKLLLHGYTVPKKKMKVLFDGSFVYSQYR